MRTTIKKNLKNLLAAILVLAALATCPVSVQAGTEDVARAAVVASVETIVQTQYPEGTPWNNSNQYFSQIKINGQTVNYTGCGCAGFAIMFNETCFGKNGSYNKVAGCNVADIQVGDIVRVNTSFGGHTYVVMSLDGAGATIAEANYNGAVHYGRYVTNAELAANVYVMHHC